MVSTCHAARGNTTEKRGTRRNRWDNLGATERAGGIPLSHARGKSESEVLREGILLAEREEKRLQAIEKLARMAEEAGPEPAPPRWRSA